MSANGINVTEAVKDSIYRSCLCLDDQKWDEWLDLCDEDFEYSITAYSPEIRRDMKYLSGSRKDMSVMLGMLPKHNSDHSPLRRHATVYTVDVDEDGKTATAVTSLVIYMEMLDGINSHIDSGESRLFATGKYHDKFRIDGGKVKFIEREVKIDNRRLDKGSHLPF